MPDPWQSFARDTFLVVGFTERTGLSVARVFEEHAIDYRISDLRSREDLNALISQLNIADDHVMCGEQTPAQLQGITRIVLSPGVPRTIPLIREAVRLGLPVQCDVDLLSGFIRDKVIVAVTGTDGKTTVTTLLGELLGNIGPTVVAGNIGVPVFDRYQDLLQCDYAVFEVSSFMLEEIETFRPTVAVITNIAEDHVDRYDSAQDYARAKLNIVRHCGPRDVLIKNEDDPTIAAFHPTHVRIRSVSRSGSLFDGELFHLGGQQLRYADCLLKGEHNIENILLCLGVATELAVDPQAALETIRLFPGVSHRFEYVGRFGGVEVYNDSKATTVHAVESAVKSFSGNVVLIMGGRGKDLNVAGLRRHRGRLKYLMAYGESGEAIRQVLDHPESGYVYGFEDAVRQAASHCRAGDVLLLSPACTSWDQFESYEVRGDVFKRLARECLT